MPDSARTIRHDPLPAPWSKAVLGVFAIMGASFGTWLSRLPAIRDHLGASTLEMSIFGLLLALGSLAGLIVSSRTVSWLGPRRALFWCTVIQSVAMPLAGALFWIGAILPAAACLVIFGIMFSTNDVAMNVDGASAERALGKPRMPLYHAGYSLGMVGSMGIGALAEAARVLVPVHFTVMFVVYVTALIIALQFVPRNSVASREAEGATPAAPAAVSVHTGPLPTIEDDGAAAPTAEPPSAARPYNPWRDPRIIIIGLITMTMGLAEGTAADWLPLALADGRGFTNEAGALTLGVFFIAMTLARISGSWLIERFGRVPVLRSSATLAIVGVSTVILVPFGWASVVGAVMWGVGCAFGFPIGISAAADDPKTAVRGVATVAMIAYTALLLGPMTIGFLGEHFGLLPAFWPLVAFMVFAALFANTARERTP